MQPYLIRRPIQLLIAALLAGSASLAFAKLPAMTPEEQAKIAASKTKAAADAEVEKQLLAKSQDRVVARYTEEQRAKGKEVTPTPVAPATAAVPSPGVTQEVPSAALNSRTTEKAGAYNESVTPQSAPGALQPGDPTQAKPKPQNQEIPADSKPK